jgi:hypothetical protein
VYINASDNHTGNERRNPTKTLRRLVNTQRPSRKLDNTLSTRLLILVGAQTIIFTTIFMRSAGEFAARANIVQIVIKAKGTTKINVCATTFNAGLRSVYISSAGNTKIATNINSNKVSPSKILSTTSVAKVPPNLIPLAQAKYLARTISPNRIGNTLFDMYPMITTRSNMEKEGAPIELNRNFHRKDLKTIEMK